jgi:hypothetical protein
MTLQMVLIIETSIIAILSFSETKKWWIGLLTCWHIRSLSLGVVSTLSGSSDDQSNAKVAAGKGLVSGHISFEMKSGIERIDCALTGMV